VGLCQSFGGAGYRSREKYYLIIMRGLSLFLVFLFVLSILNFLWVFYLLSSYCPEGIGIFLNVPGSIIAGLIAGIFLITSSDLQASFFVKVVVFLSFITASFLISLLAFRLFISITPCTTYHIGA